MILKARTCHKHLLSYFFSKICKICFFVIFFQTPWLWNTRHCWYNYPYQVRKHYCLGFYTHRISSLGQSCGFRQVSAGWAATLLFGPLPLLLGAGRSLVRKVVYVLSEVHNQNSSAVADGQVWKVHLLESRIQSIQQQKDSYF